LITDNIFNRSLLDYCSGGCKVTVEIMGRLASMGLKNMERAKIDSTESLDITTLSNGLCSLKEFKKYEAFVEDSCIKIMKDHKYHFLNAFAGNNTSLVFILLLEYLVFTTYYLIPIVLRLMLVCYIGCIGRKSTLFSSIRGNLFQAKKEACVNGTNACPTQLFDTNTIPPKDR
jgi:hypothetical protein